MYNLKFKLGLGTMLMLALALMSADHIDAPAVSGGASDITDFYGFQGEDSDNIVFVANLQGLLSPGNTGNTTFDENTMVEFNIDTDGDAVEDLVIQAIPRDGKMYFFGPTSPANTGKSSEVLVSANQSSVDITAYGEAAKIGSNNGMMMFAGPRDDPFFMDFAKYREIIGGTASGFDDPGTDTFAGTNVMSIAVEVPKSMIGGSGSINTWVETKTK